MRSRLRSSFLVLITFAFTHISIGETFADEVERSATGTIGKIYKQNVSSVVSISTYDQRDNLLSEGTGFVVDKEGTVVTNQHVVSDAEKITVKFKSGAFFSVAGVRAVNCAADLAILELAARGVNFDHVTISDNLRIEVGDSVVAIGNPLSLEASLSDGIISGIRESSGAEIKYIQTTAPVSHGNSGGPLFDIGGKVIGIVTFKYAEGENVNFAVSAESLIETLSSQTGINSIYLPVKEYSCTPSERQSKGSSRITHTIPGTYSGTWESYRGAVGVASLVMDVFYNSVEGKLLLVGDLGGYSGDSFVGDIEQFNEKIWKAKIRTSDGKFSATAVIENGIIIGDFVYYDYINRPVERRGRWILEKEND